MLLREKWKLPVEHLSASALSDLLSCPELYRQERILKIPKRLNIDLFIGRLHHQAIAANMAQKVDSGADMTLDQMNTAYRYIWQEQLDEQEPEWKEHPERVEALGMAMLKTFHEHIAPTIKPIAVEQRFEMPIKGLPVPVIGYIDIEELGCIDELKTTAQKVSSPKPNWRFQGRVYQLVVSKPVIWTVTTKQKTPVNWSWDTCPELRMDPTNPDVTVDLIVRAAEMLNDFYTRLGPETPWPLTGLMHPWLCTRCAAGPKSREPKCPAWKESSDGMRDVRNDDRDGEGLRVRDQGLGEEAQQGRDESRHVA